MKAEELFSVEGLSTVVTGGANGLGFAMARALADNGARVTIVDVDGKAAAAAGRVARRPIRRQRRTLGITVRFRTIRPI